MRSSRKQKYICTSLLHYGVDHPMQTDEIKEKRNKTCLEKYGAKTPLNSKELREKSKKTCIERYGNEFFSSSAVGRTLISKSRKLEQEYDGDFYDLQATKNFCLNIDSKYLKSGGYRTLIKEDKKMYFSILHYATEISKCKNITFRSYVYFLQDKINEYKCPLCGAYYKWDNDEFVFKMPSTDIHYKYDRTLEHYTKIYGYELGLKKFNNYNEKRKIGAEKNKKQKTNSKEYYIKKYGKELGEKLFIERMNNRIAKSKKSYSKISQKFFNELMTICNLDKSKCYYATNNGEKPFTLTLEYEKLLDQCTVRPDFLVSNKIIEFNGVYWHRNSFKKDFIKKQFFESIGMEVLIIWEDEEWDLALKRAQDFLNSGRYQIETANGYSNFDGIRKKEVSEILKISLKNGDITVSKDHRFVVYGKEVFAHTLKIGDILISKDLNPSRIINIELIKEKTEVYDILNTDDHTYIANNIVNHNCSFIGSSETLVSAEALESFKSKEPIITWDSKLKIYQEPEPKHKYIMAVDPSKCYGDAFAVHIIDITAKPFIQAASAQLFNENFQRMPIFLDEWGRRYNNAFMIIENNEGAGTFVAVMLKNDYEYPNLFYDKTYNKMTPLGKLNKEPGFRTTTKSRNLILDTLKLFLDNKLLLLNDSATIQELYTFVAINGKYQAEDGYHDDMVMALAVAFAPFCNSRNFDDMSKIIDTLYDDTVVAGTLIGEHLAIGNFDDYCDSSLSTLDTQNGFGDEFTVYSQSLFH